MYALDGRAGAIVGPDTVVECLALGTELCEVAARSGDPERVAEGHMIRIIAQLQEDAALGRLLDEVGIPRVARGRFTAPTSGHC